MLGRWLDRLFPEHPCDRCGILGGSRWDYGERIAGRIVRRSLCADCRSYVFLHGWRDRDRDWCKP